MLFLKGALHVFGSNEPDADERLCVSERAGTPEARSSNSSAV